MKLQTEWDSITDFSQSWGAEQVCERAVKRNQSASPGGEGTKEERKEGRKPSPIEIYKIWSHEWDLNIKSAQPVIPSM